jgi:acetoin utilization deacetylase AcuC-like enzyme
MPRTALITHQAMLKHDTGLGHPESPDRLRAALAALDAADFADLIRVEAPLVSDEAVSLVHPKEFVDRLYAAAPRHEGMLVGIDADTVMSAGTIEAMQRAAGAVTCAVDGVVAGRWNNAFCAVRPPGHHAEPTQAMGFCFFNNAAIGALHARAAHKLQRVAVIDFDVHHGNGSQTVAEADPDFFYGSIHDAGAYPGTGFAHEKAHGNLVNAPVPSGSAGPAWRRAFETHIMPALERFEPAFIVISAGFDAHALDPLASLRLETEDFDWATGEIMALAHRYCGGRLVSTLEGGYHLAALGRCVSSHVNVLMRG